MYTIKSTSVQFKDNAQVVDGIVNAVERLAQSRFNQPTAEFHIEDRCGDIVPYSEYKGFIKTAKAEALRLLAALETLDGDNDNGQYENR